MPVAPAKTAREIPKRGSKLYLEQAEGECLDIYLNGTLVVEAVCQKAHTEDDWKRKLAEARSLVVLPKLLEQFANRLGKIHNREDHNFPTPDKKVIAYLMGFADGILGIELDHPANKDFTRLKLKMQRDYSPCFTEGFELGECVRNINQTKGA